ncbi:MAG: ABC transporter substrate-binding protein [Chloroflexota bacterium]
MTTRSPGRRVRALVLGLVAAGSLLTAAALPVGAQSPAAGTSSGTLVAGITSDPDTLYPWKATQFQAVGLLTTIYGTLTELDADLNVVPGIAESWTSSEDGKTLTFKIRDGLTFQDGTPLTSADVKASFEAIQNEDTAAVAASTLAGVTAIDAPDASTVVLTMDGPNAGILSGLASVNLAILPASQTEEALNAQPNGTGPYMLKSRTPNESLTLVANPTYWRGAPSLAEIDFRIVPDETSIVSGIEAGNINFAILDDPLVAQQAEADGVAIARTPQLAYHALQLNAARDPLSDVNVRLAIQCAIDRQQVLDTAALGEGEVVGPITSPAYKSDPNARPCPTRDVAKAKEYLAKAGKADGVTIGTIVSQGEYATSVNEAQNIQAQLAEAGITLNLEVLDIDTYVQRWLDADFDTAIALNGGRPDPDTMYGRYFTSTGSLNKVAGFSSPELDQLFAQGKATIDPAARKPIYDQISKYLEDNAVWIWNFSSDTYTATTPNVTGFTPMPNASLQYLRETTIQ